MLPNPVLGERTTVPLCFGLLHDLQNKTDTIVDACKQTGSKSTKTERPTIRETEDHTMKYDVCLGSVEPLEIKLSK